jgi:hypothetical protein
VVSGGTGSWVSSLPDTVNVQPSGPRGQGAGHSELTTPVTDDAAAQMHLIFDPIPRLAGIEPSDDPLLELRAAIYLIRGRRRRAA